MSAEREERQSISPVSWCLERLACRVDRFSLLPLLKVGDEAADGRHDAHLSPHGPRQRSTSSCARDSFALARPSADGRERVKDMGQVQGAMLPHTSRFCRFAVRQAGEERSCLLLLLVARFCVFGS